MKTEKRNQHYVPKFYLRNFSVRGGGKQIGLFNTIKETFVGEGKLKTQAAKSFFYGEDGKIEDALSILEGELATVVRNIIATRKLPKKNSAEYKLMLLFVTLTDLRNPTKIEGAMQMFQDSKRAALAEYPETTNSDELFPTLTHEESVRLNLLHAMEMRQLITDLDCKLLINETSSPFVTSDYPIVKYN